MAEYLIQDTTLTAIGDAIRAKEGSSGTIPVSAFASRISAIKTVQRVSGTFTTNSRGNATVNCGFKPDCVTIINPRNDNTDYVFSATAHFAYDQDVTGTFNILMRVFSDDYFSNSFDVTQTNNGFSVLAENIGFNNVSSAAGNAVFNYYAVKYE